MNNLYIKFFFLLFFLCSQSASVCVQIKMPQRISPPPTIDVTPLGTMTDTAIITNENGCMDILHVYMLNSKGYFAFPKNQMV